MPSTSSVATSAAAAVVQAATGKKSSSGPTIVKFSHTYGHDPAHYPIKALAYSLQHPSLWSIVLRVACIGCTLAVMILVILMVTALKPQAELISPNLEWWAWLVAVLLVLLEAGLAAAFLMIVTQSKAQTKLFVATMRTEGQWRENEMIPQATIKDMNLIKKAFMVRMITFPIQLIPLVGGAIYSAINATFSGWDYMDRYFDAIKLPSRLQRIEVFGADKSDCSALFYSSTYDSDNDYARFGFMCSFLESIPIVGSMVFPLTNAVAAALFACDIEKSGGPVCLRGDGNSPNGGTQGGYQNPTPANQSKASDAGGKKS